MIHDRSLSDEPVIGNWLQPDSIDMELLESWERGGVALNDVSEGLTYQDWKLTIEGDELVLYPQQTGGRIVIFTLQAGVGARVTSLSLAFDQNMDWTALVYTSDTNETYHYWYDSTIPGYQITTYDDMTGAMLSLDDKRAEQLRLGGTDILLFYLKPGSGAGNMALWYRQQRDRFGIEYNLGEFANVTGIRRVGMSDVGRVQIELTWPGTPLPDTDWPTYQQPPATVWPDCQGPPNT